MIGQRPERPLPPVHADWHIYAACARWTVRGLAGPPIMHLARPTAAAAIFMWR